MINPINYEIKNGDLAIILATDFAHAQRFEDKNNKTETQIEEIKFTADLEFIKNYDYDMSSYSRRGSNIMKKPEDKLKSERIQEKFSEFLDETFSLRGHIIVFGPLESLPSLIE